MIAFLSRITKTHAYIAIYHISNALTAVLGLASVLVVFIDCPAGSSYYWAFHDNRLLTCPSQVSRLQLQGHHNTFLMTYTERPMAGIDRIRHRN